MDRFTLSIGLGTLLIFGIGGIVLIEWVQERSYVEVFLQGWGIGYQLAAGFIAGLAGSGLALLIITRPFFKEERKDYYELISSRLNLKLPVIIFLSLCAGVGEEIFFRAGLQPLIGLHLTSVIFVALHGYLQLTNWRVALYGLAMLMVIVGFGYLYHYTGLYTVMMAHSIFDFVLFIHIAYSQDPQAAAQDSDLIENRSPSP